MTAAATPTTPAASPTSATVRRTTALAGANTRLMTRNRLTLFYATALPLLPLLPIVLGSGADPDGIEWAQTWIGTSFLVAWLFPVYYNLLSIIVSRRDELVLKRLRTVEARDGELIVGMALPGVAIAVAVSAVIVVVGVAKGLGAPVNPVLLVVTVLAGCLVFVALAVWTAAWTKTAEAAQLTSMPVILLAMLGNLAYALPESVRPYLVINPMTALDELVRLTWFGQQDYDMATSLGFLETWAAAALPLGVLAAWTGFAIWLARRSMRWEPRA